MTLAELEEQIRLLSFFDKIQLVQSITGMLTERSGETLLQQMAVAAQAAEFRYLGPLEAYEAASQLQELHRRGHAISGLGCSYPASA